MSKAEIRSEMNAREFQWNAERDEALLELNAADRRNLRRFDELTETMFARLYHEALHAYLENYLYPRSQYDVPVWLHEGLAQFFQNGRLEADTLRIDSLPREALLTVQRDLASGRPVSLAELLETEDFEFISGERRRQLYAHAWALVYYLAIEQGVIGTESLERIVTRRSEALEDETQRKAAQIARFQELVDRPLFDFQQLWHEAMLELKP